MSLLRATGIPRVNKPSPSTIHQLLYSAPKSQSVSNFSIGLSTFEPKSFTHAMRLNIGSLEGVTVSINDAWYGGDTVG